KQDAARLFSGGWARDGSCRSPAPGRLRDRSRGGTGTLLASDGSGPPCFAPFGAMQGKQAGPGPSTSIWPPPETTRSSPRSASRQARRRGTPNGAAQGSRATKAADSARRRLQARRPAAVLANQRGPESKAATRAPSSRGERRRASGCGAARTNSRTSSCIGSGREQEDEIGAQPSPDGFAGGGDTGPPAPAGAGSAKVMKADGGGVEGNHLGRVVVAGAADPGAGEVKADLGEQVAVAAEGVGIGAVADVEVGAVVA